MISRVSALAALVLLLMCGVLVAAASGQDPEPTPTTTEPTPDPAPVCGAQQIQTLRYSVRYWRAATWRWDDRMFKEHTRVKGHDATYVRSCAVLKAMSLIWHHNSQVRKKQFVKFKKTFQYQLYRADRDFNHALTLASKVYNVSRSWLHACAKSEGGTGAWVPNRQGSGAGGWMQFMSGTFYGYVDSAFAHAKRLGVYVPSQFRSWYSRVGQAFTAAYMFSTGQSGHWVGHGC